MGAVLATLIGCSSCPYQPLASIEACTSASGFACFDRMAAAQPIDAQPASFKVNSETIKVRSTIAANTDKPSPAHARDSDHFATKAAKPAVIAAKVEPLASSQPADNGAASSATTGANLASSLRQDGSAANSNIRSIQEQVTVADAAAEHAATTDAAPQQNANNTDHFKTLLGRDTEKTAPASPNNTDHLVAILLVRPEIKSVADLANKNVAIDEWQSVSAPSVRTAIMAAGAAEVQMSEGKTLAIERVMSGEVPAAVLALVPPEAAGRWVSKMGGFKLFRIPLSRQ